VFLIALIRVDTKRCRFGLKNIKSFDKVNLSIKKRRAEFRRWLVHDFRLSAA
jgi:hypothetical protein